MQKLFTLLLMTGLLLLFPACPPPAENPPAGELPAVDITARVQGLAVVLSWSNPADLVGFEVYRQEGMGAFALAAASAENKVILPIEWFSPSRTANR